MTLASASAASGLAWHVVAPPGVAGTSLTRSIVTSLVSHQAAAGHLATV